MGIFNFGKKETNEANETNETKDEGKQTEIEKNQDNEINGTKSQHEKFVDSIKYDVPNNHKKTDSNSETEGSDHGSVGDVKDEGRDRSNEVEESR